MGFVRRDDREGRERQMRILRGDGLSLRAIASIFDCNAETVREAVVPGLKERRNAERAAHNTSPEGLQRQRDYRAKRAS